MQNAQQKCTASSPAEHQLDSLMPVSVNDLRKLIMLSPTKSCALDPIPTKVMKDATVLETLLPYITSCINASLAVGVVPSSMKSAIVIPLLKKDGLDVNNYKNYRPVSNLTFLSKLLEKVVAKQLLQHMASYNLSDDLQSAYRSGHSTETALMKVKNDIDTAMDGGYGVLLLLLDLSAAFDTLDHHILLERLASYFGITGIAMKWVVSYLASRTQTVAVDDARSHQMDLSTGVPQGSVLGPLLFLAYIRPLGSIIDVHGVHRHGYADDTQMYVKFALNDNASLQSAIATLEACVEDVRTWMIQNKLKLNDAKTEFLLIAPKYHSTKLLRLKPKIKVGNESIEPSKSARNLGAIFDQHMSMVSHVGKTTRSMYYNIRRVAKIRHHLDANTCAIAIHALVTSRLDFQNALLANLPQSTLRPLQLAQNSAARLITGAKKRDHITPVLRHLHWLPVPKRIMYKLIILTYKVVHDISPPRYLSSLLTLHKPVRSLRSGENAFQLKTPKIKKDVGLRAFQAAGPSLWNTLPTELRVIPSLPVFKSKLKTFLF